MPAVVALAIRALVQFGITFGIVSLAERFVLPLINKAIQEVMEFFGVSEETAQDIMANEVLQFVEAIGIGTLVLRTKLPIKTAERLGFTTKGWNFRKLSSTTEKAVVAAKAGGEAVVSQVASTISNQVVATGAAAGFLSQRVKDIIQIIGVGVGLPTAFLYMIAQYIDYASWQGSAYQNTFQKIFSWFGLNPDKSAVSSAVLSDDMWKRLIGVYQNIGVKEINDPYKGYKVPFTLINLKSLVDKIAAQILTEKGKVTLKEIIAATQGFMILGAPVTDAKINSVFAVVPTTGAAVEIRPPVTPVKVFTGVVSQGILGTTQDFTPREEDLIDSTDELKNAAQNNLAMFLTALPGRIIYEIKIVASITNKDGTRRLPATQQVIKGYRKDGSPIYKTVSNKFAVADVYIFTARNIRTKIDSIILGPTDSVALQLSQTDLQNIGASVKSDIQTSDISQIFGASETLAPAVGAPMPEKPKGLDENEFNKVFGISASYHFFADVDKKLYSGIGTHIFERDYRELLRDLAQKRDRILAAGYDPRLVEPYKKREDDMYKFEVLATDYKGFPGEPIKTQPNEPILAAYQFAGPKATLPEVAIPTSNNPNRCLTATIAEFFDVNRQTYPSVAERSKLYEAFGLGPANWYTGTYEQNIKLLNELKRRSGCA